MARKVIKKPVAKKTVRKTKSEVYLVNHKYLGDEPDPKKFKNQSDVMRAYSWYGSMCEVSDARQYLKDYLTRTNEKDYAKKVDKIPDAWVPLTWAWKCRMTTLQGSQWDLPSYQKFMAALDDAISHTREEKAEDKLKADKPNIQERMRDRLSDIIGDIEAMLDTGEVFSLYDWLKKNEIPAMYTGKIADFYQPLFQEYYDALNGDKEVLEGYRTASKAYLKARATQVATIIEDANKYGSNTKKLRAPRKKKPMSVEKKLRFFKYMKEDKDMKLASVDPQTIVGAQELWTYNAKYKTLTVFRALDRGGLDVKRSNIVGFDEKTSLTKRTGRQGEKIVKQVMDGGKITLRKLMDEIKAPQVDKIQDRTNENVLLLRVVK